jgi:CRP-like cAMP-binding protein
MPRSKIIGKQQIILYQGEASTGVHVVTKGAVKSYVILANGNEVIIAIAIPKQNDAFAVMLNV